MLQLVPVWKRHAQLRALQVPRMLGLSVWSILAAAAPITAIHATLSAAALAAAGIAIAAGGTAVYAALSTAAAASAGEAATTHTCAPCSAAWSTRAERFLPELSLS